MNLNPLRRFATLLFLAATAVSQASPTIPNASFEQGSHAAPGYGIIPDWNHSTLGMGLNTSSGPFANNGTIPNGNQVAFIQTNSSSLTLSTTISGLTPGTLYRVTFRANMRSGYAAPAVGVAIDDPEFLKPVPLSINGGTPSSVVGLYLPSQIGSTQYHTLNFTFTAKGTSANMALRSSSVGDGALLLDAFTIVPVQISTHAWTGDASSGISREATRWAYNFGTSQSTTINGVEIPGIANPTNNFSNADFQIAGLSATQTFNSNNLTGLTGQGSAILGRDVAFRSSPAARGTSDTLTLKGLAPGRSYTLSVFTYGLGPDGLLTRLTTFASSGGESLTLSPSLFSSNNGMRIDIKFTATSSQHVITATVANDNNASFRYCGLALSTEPIFVTNLDDSGPGSLRDALAQAASVPGPDRIFFDPSLGGGTISLSQGADRNALVVDDPGGVLIDASDLVGGIRLGPAGTGYRALRVAAGSSLEAIGLEISGFDTSGGGPRISAAAILNEGTLALESCNLSDNSAEHSGGAIQNLGSLTLTDCTLSGNDSNDRGGAIDSGDAASLTLSQCDLSGNSGSYEGGAIYSSGVLSVTACSFSNNISRSGSGGAIHHDDDSDLILTDCTLADNTAALEGGAIFKSPSTGQLQLTACSLIGNRATTGGGAIHCGGCDLELTDCRLIGNRGSQGGAIHHDSFELIVTRCFLSENTASSSGGGIYKLGGALNLTRSSFGGNTSAGTAGALRISQCSAALMQCSFAENTATSGGAIDASGNLTLSLTHCTLSTNAATGSGGAILIGGTLNLVNSIVADNTAPTGPNLSTTGTVTISPQGTNLIDDPSGSGLDGALGVIGGDPLLGLLADYGGATPTMALRPGSPARNAASIFSPALITSDQRGLPLLGPPDIGAYEAGQAPWPNFAAELAESLPNTGPAHGVSPGGDFDGDGNSNEDEAGFGTDMLNPNSFFRPGTTFAGGMLSFDFPTRSDRSYHLQWSETLGDDWTTQEWLNGDGGQRSFSVAYPAAGRLKRFYRIRVADYQFEE